MKYFKKAYIKLYYVEKRYDIRIGNSAENTSIRAAWYSLNPFVCVLMCCQLISSGQL